MPLIPSYLTYISGVSFGDMKAADASVQIRMTVVLHSLVFIAGFSAVFIALGGLAGFASVSFQVYLRDGLGIIQKKLVVS